MKGAAENKYSNSSVCEDASACVGSSFSNGLSETWPPGSFSLRFLLPFLQPVHALALDVPCVFSLSRLPSALAAKLV